MTYHSLRYSLKVWLSSVFLAPLIYDIIQFFFNRSQPDTITNLYPVVILVELIFSFFTWLTFWGITVIARRFLDKRYLRRILLSVIGIILTIGTFVLITFPNILISINDIAFSLTLSNCICIGIASVAFNLDPRVDFDQTIEVN